MTSLPLAVRLLIFGPTAHLCRALPPALRLQCGAVVMAAVMALVMALTGCSASVIGDAERLARAGQQEHAYALLRSASASAPLDHNLSVALLRQREDTLTQLAYHTELAISSGRLDAARVLIDKLNAMDPQHPRVVALRGEVERGQRHARWLQEARVALNAQRHSEATALVNQVLAEAPGYPGARALQTRMRERTEPVAQTLGAAFQKPVVLEFREAPLRQVFEALSRSSGINFVFDKDVRGDAKVTMYLKDVSIDDALKVILSTQQLDRKLLGDSTVLIYPNNQSKQREHQELITRSFYLRNADVKQAQALVRTIAKTRDMFIDERLNLLVMRDTPEVLALAERLIGSIDLPEPEVVLEVEVLEISSNKLDELGIRWPEQIQYGLPSGGLSVEVGERGNFRASIANPAVTATLRDTTSRGNLLANPRLRARNHEKAKVLIGEKLPIFTTTQTGSVGGVATTVTYIEVGLKLDVEPSVQLDNDVVMKVNLEVSSVIGRVPGPQNTVAYQIGTRQASTSLRLRDGETQILAGLIKEEEQKSIAGLPLLADLPLVGRLFGVHSDQRIKTEVVLLITPRVVRNISLPEASVMQIPSGIDGSPGALTARLSPQAKVAVPLAGSALSAAPTGTVTASAPGNSAVLVLATSGEVAAGETVSVTLQNRSVGTLQGELEFDPLMLQGTQGGERNVGRLPFTLAPGAEQVFVLRTLPAAAGHTLDVTAVGLSAKKADGSALPVRVEGDGAISVSSP